MTYGIVPSQQKKLRHKDYKLMLSNISPDSILCGLIRIRSEKDNKKINEFSDYQKEIYWKWQDFKNRRYMEMNNITRTEMIDEQMKMFIG